MTITIIGSQVTVKTAPGIRRIDHLIELNGKIYAIEVKAGKAVRTAKQILKDRSMATVGVNLPGRTGLLKITTKVFQVP